MWLCPSCNLFNEDLDEVCARCAQARIALYPEAAASGAEGPVPAQQTAPAAPAAPAAVTPSADAAAPAKADSLAWVVILVAVVLLGGVGYLAWQRGLIKLPSQSATSPTVVPAPSGEPASQPPADGTAPAETNAGETSDEAAAEPASDPLADLDDNVAGIAVYRGWRDYLRKLDTDLEAVSFEADAAGKLVEASSAALDKLNEQGLELNQKYTDFENQCSRDTSADLVAYQSTLRRAFRDRMVKVVTLAGSAHQIEKEGVHPAYTLPDTYIATIKQFDRENPRPIEQAWSDAAHAHEQNNLDQQHADTLKTLQDSLKMLQDIHKEYNKKFAEMPPYHVRGGVLGKDAAELLDLYESLATKVEELTVAHEKFVAGLDQDALSDRMKEAIKSFTDLAREDHLYCFTETYTIYAQDRQLDHPAYERLKDHNAFALEHWPTQRDQYVGVYTHFEEAWDQRWKEQ